MPIKTEFVLLSVEHCLLTSKLLQIFFTNINNKRHWFDKTISKFIHSKVNGLNPGVSVVCVV